MKVDGSSSIMIVMNGASETAVKTQHKRQQNQKKKSEIEIQER